MQEYAVRQIAKEEEFLNEFYNAAAVSANLLGNEWDPCEDCNDEMRMDRKRMFSAGQLYYLAFDGASVNHKAGKFSSVDIFLKSSTRIANVRVHWVNEDWIAEKMLDRPVSQT